ncbi:tyrosine-protein kinase receptor torso-like [Phlebotomus argentipes]|uniref:tyrosine-protein kinase receptor torso-like n=1 Tax=Phlebotomus argentipes TaxID=94469 RepID=UPI0028937623|nr:tyrosine-protein kinase receptor torso-like [Phlebotomus argentipes]
MNFLPNVCGSLRIFLVLTGLLVISETTLLIPEELSVKELQCVFYCLANTKNSTKMLDCYKICSNSLSEKYGEEVLKKNHKLAKTVTTNDLSMVCRDDTSVTTRMSVEHPVEYPNYVVIQYKVSNELNDSFYLANNPIAVIDLLQPGTFYRISGFGFKGSKLKGIKEVFHVLPTTFRTLNHGPIKEASDISVVNYHIHPVCKSCLFADVQWSPSADQICHYSIAWHDNLQGDLHEVPLTVESDLKSHYEITIGELEFAREYKVAVRSFMHNSQQVKNDFNWQSFVTPQCREIYTKPADILEVCSPLQPANVKAVVRDAHTVTVTWDKPSEPLPHYYTVSIRNLDYERPFATAMNVNGDRVKAIFKELNISGVPFEVDVEAVYANGKRSYTTIQGQLISSKGGREKKVDFLLVGFLTIFCITIMLYIMTVISTKHCKSELEVLKNEDIHYINDSLEVDIDCVTVNEMIGEGHFGMVKKGELRKFETHLMDYSTTTVAVKMLKDPASKDEIEEFIQEINIMKSVPKHPNIVSILGHCTGKGDDMLLLTEYCAKGSLLDHLRNQWRVHGNQQNMLRSEKIFRFLIGIRSVSTNYVNNPVYFANDADDFTVTVTIKALLNMAIQVAEGMTFLAINKVVHRDLAARNVLVTEHNTMKIADFGLSRDIYNNGIYKKRSSGRVPIKWMALEALSRQVYTTQSDVWSFGVLLYEIFTLGCIPYPTIENDQLLVYLRTGARMEMPPNCSLSLYKLMRSCWAENPNERPSFNAIAAELKDEMDNQAGDELFDLEKLNQDDNLIRDSLSQLTASSAYLTPINDA